MAYPKQLPTQEQAARQRFEHLQPDESVLVFERKGYCSRCGECCKGDPFNGEEGHAIIEGYCPLFDLLEGKGHCTDRQHPYYLNGCNVWPTHPDQLADKPSCTYSFTLVENASDNV